MKRGGFLARRTPLKRTASLKGGGPLPRESKRHRESGRIPPEVRAEVRARSGGRCEATGIHHRCMGWAMQMHHRLPRGLGGKHTAANLLDVCDNAHRVIHANPAISYEIGYLRHSWEQAA